MMRSPSPPCPLRPKPVRALLAEGREELLARMGDLARAAEDGDGHPAERLRALRDEAAAAAARCFELEEGLLARAAHPELEGHRVAHAWFTARLRALALEGRPPLSNIDFLLQWLVAHLHGADHRHRAWLADGDGARCLAGCGVALPAANDGTPAPLCAACG